jgi:hypothetical protein
MDTEKPVNEEWDWYDNPDPAEEAKHKALLAAYMPKRKVLLDRVRAGEMTEDECADAILQLQKDLGYVSPFTDEQEKDDILNNMMHSLHQDELDRLRREEGIIVD